MQINFYKYQGTGNDFIIIDNREEKLFRYQTDLYTQLCHRNFGIGADGVILLQSHENHDFEMIYFNADGKEGSMCGNGGRCVIHFAHQLGLIQSDTTFLAIDGLHEGIILPDNQVKLKMKEVTEIEHFENDLVLDTGSPHYVRFVPALKDVAVIEMGRKVRFAHAFMKEGINVNFVEAKNDKLQVATYERGVENETLSCGTGVVACSIAATLQLLDFMDRNEINLITKGGNLSVSFEKSGNHHFKNIWLKGPVESVFTGSIEI